VVVGFLALGAGLCEVFSTFTNWWTLHSDLSGGITIGFLPGGTLHDTVGGVTSDYSYASEGLGPMAGLYGGVLALLIVLIVLAVGSGVIALYAGWGRLGDSTSHGTVHRLILAELVLAAAVLLATVFLQPALWRSTDPGGICGAFTSPQSVCTAFWGTGTSATASLIWGASLGWYLLLGAVVPLVAALLLWARAGTEGWPLADGTTSGLPPAGGPASEAPSSLLPRADEIERLFLLARLLDSGQITADEFRQAKGRLLASLAARESTPPRTDLAGDLRQLAALHDHQLVDDGEYESLRRTLLLSA
jgi:hypothetical protein